MFAEHLAGAIASAGTLAQLDALAGDMWRAYGSGMFKDADAERISGQIEARRADIRPRDTVARRAPVVARLAQSIFPAKRRRPRSPDRAASIARRRTLAASGVMPPALASMFTTGELAALRIVSDEGRTGRGCELTIGEIASRAGVGETVARGAIRAAAAAGLLLVIERRQRRAPNLPNLVRIVSREWLAWIAKRPARSPQGIGFGNVRATDREINSRERTQLKGRSLSMKDRREMSSYRIDDVSACGRVDT